jgi:hypothetical protein
MFEADKAVVMSREFTPFPDLGGGAPFLTASELSPQVWKERYKY